MGVFNLETQPKVIKNHILKHKQTQTVVLWNTQANNEPQWFDKGVANVK